MTKSEFEEDINIGDVLKFETEEGTFVGRVERLGETGVKITNINTNKPKVTLYSNIIEYDFDIGNENTLNLVSINSKKEDTPVIISDQKNDDKRISYEINMAIDEKIKNFFIESVEPIDLSVDTIFKSVKKDLNEDLKKKIDKIKSQLFYAKQMHEDGLEKSKIRKIFVELTELSHEDYRVNTLKGVLNYEYGRKECIDDFIAGKEYRLAFYAAEQFQGVDKSLYDASILAIENKSYDKHQLLWILKYIKNNSKQDAMHFVFNLCEENKYEQLLFWYKGTNIVENIPCPTEINSEDNFNYLKNIFEEEFYEQGDELKAILLKAKIEEKSSEEIEQIENRKGFITDFGKIDDDLGRIDNTLFFSLNQVSDNRVVKMLYSGIIGLPVIFKIGYSDIRPGKLAAYDVRFDESPINESKQGNIFDYKSYENFGVITEKKKRYFFRLDAVIDPILKCGLDKSFLFPPIKVFYDLRTLETGKTIAFNVRAENQFSKDIFEKAKQYLNSELVENWKLIVNKTYAQDLFQEAPAYMPLEPYYGTKDNITINFSSYNYFKSAEKAVANKQFDKAISDYEKAIEYGDNRVGAILNLSLLYSRLEDIENALHVLDKNRLYIEDKPYWNTRKQILTKKINKDYEREIIEVFEKVKQYSVSYAQQIDYQEQKARALYLLEKYDESKKIYENLLKEKTTNIPKTFILRVLINIYIQLDEINIAKAYAQKLIQIQPDDEIAKSILNGTVNKNNYILEEEILNIEEFSSSDISNFLEKIVDDINLSAEVKVKHSHLFKDDDFIGSEEDANKLFQNFLTPDTRKEIDRSIFTKRFVRAKIIKQIIARNTREDTRHFSEITYRHNIAYGTKYYANMRLQDISTDMPRNVDTSRFCYLEAAKIFNESNTKEPCWYDSLLSFYKSFYTDIPREITKPECPENQNQREEQFYKQLESILKQNLKYEIKPFIYEIFESLEYGGPFSSNFKQVLAKSDFVISLIKKEVNISEQNPLKVIDLFINEFKNDRINFKRQLIKLVEKIFNLGQFELLRGELNSNKILNFLNETDREYWNSFQNILIGIQKFNESPDNGQKIEYLSVTNEKYVDLQKQISQSPTRFSYDILLSTISSSIEKSFRSIGNELYASSVPQISISEPQSIGINEEDGICGFSLSFTNKENSNAATNIEIKIDTENSSIVFINKNQVEKISLLKGNGKPLDRFYQFKIPDKSIKFASFKISFSYSYKKNMSLEDDDSVEKSISIPLTNYNFKEIDNKFKQYMGGDPIEAGSDMFFGREEEINEIKKEIESSSSNSKCVVLYGQKRTGKSSILNQIDNYYNNMNDDRYIVVNFGSIARSGFKENNITGFLHPLLNKILISLKLHSSLYEQLLSSGLNIEDKIDAILDDNFVKGQAIFDRLFEELQLHLNKVQPQYKIILMIDEFTYIYKHIRQGRMTDDFMKFWKALFQNNKNIFGILIGQDHMPQFISAYQNEFGTVHPIKITYLPKKDAVSLMTDPIRIPETNESRYMNESVTDLLFKYTAGNACLLMKICSDLVDIMNNEIKSNYITAANISDYYLKKKLDNIDESLFHPLYQDESDITNPEKLETDNKNILRRIAQSCGKADWCSIESVVQSEDDKKLLENLIKRDVVERKDGNNCRIKVVLYKEWILHMFGYGE